MFSFNIDKTKRNEYIFLGSIFVFAFCLRLIYTLQIQTLPTFTVLIVDAFSYNEWAKNIISKSNNRDKRNMIRKIFLKDHRQKMYYAKAE